MFSSQLSEREGVFPWTYSASIACRFPKEPGRHACTIFLGLREETDHHSFRERKDLTEKKGFQVRATRGHQPALQSLIRNNRNNRNNRNVFDEPSTEVNWGSETIDQ